MCGLEARLQSISRVRALSGKTSVLRSMCGRAERAPFIGSKVLPIHNEVLYLLFLF